MPFIYQSERHPEIIDRIERCLNECGLATESTKSRRPALIYRAARSLAVSGLRGKSRSPAEVESGCRHLLPYRMGLPVAPYVALAGSVPRTAASNPDGDGFKTEKCGGVTWTPRSWTICSAKPFIDRLQALAIHGFTANSRSELGGRKESIWIVTVSPQAWRSVGGYGDRPQIEVKAGDRQTVWLRRDRNGNHRYKEAG